MKDEASMEISKSSEKADKPEMGLGAEKGDVEMADFKEFKYEEPELKTSEAKDVSSKSEEVKNEEPKKETSEENNSSKEIKKDDKGKKMDKETKKDIEESLRNAGVKLKEGIKDYLPRAGFIRDDDEDKSSRKIGLWGGQGSDEQLRKAKIIAKVKFANGDRMGRVTKDDLDRFEEYKEQYDEIYGSDDWDDEIAESLKNAGVKLK